MNSFLSLQTNEYIVQILQNIYADTNGEIANFLQFSYQQFCLAPFPTPLKIILENIAKDDFLHAKILAKNIVLLGHNPQMKNSDNKFFSTKQLQTETSQNRIIDLDIELKEKSILNYKSAMLKISNKTIKQDLTRIVEEEDLHLQMLKNLKNKINAGKI